MKSVPVRSLWAICCVAGLALSAARPVPAQTIPELYDLIAEATQQKQFAKAADLYNVFFEKKPTVTSWDYFRVAQACAGAGRRDAAFGWLDKMVLAGWLDDEMLAKEPNLQSLHTDSRWSALIAHVRAAMADSPR